jgi:hypothetical protein
LKMKKTKTGISRTFTNISQAARDALRFSAFATLAMSRERKLRKSRNIIPYKGYGWKYFPISGKAIPANMEENMTTRSSKSAVRNIGNPLEYSRDEAFFQLEGNIEKELL